MYRIYTEDINREGIIQTILSLTPSATITPAIGLWQNARESSLVIDLVRVNGKVAEELARRIGLLNGQKNVLIVEIKATGKLV